MQNAYGWGGVGWGGVITFMLTCTPTSCYARVIFSCTHTDVHVNLHTLSVRVEKQLAIHDANVQPSFQQLNKVRYTIYDLH